MLDDDDDVKTKIVDIYNYMAINKISVVELRFDTGIKMICKIDDSEWKNRPVIDLIEFLNTAKLIEEENKREDGNE